MNTIGERMKAIKLHHPAGIDNLHLVELEDPGSPQRGEIRVRVLANSLNYHDYAVIVGRLPTPHGRIPLSDAGGVIEAVGEDVEEFKVGDKVVSCFSTTWQAGAPCVSNFSTAPGDGVEGYAQNVVVRPAHWFTHAPHGWTHEEASTLTVAGLTAWRALVVNGGIKAGDTVLVLGTGGVSIFALQFAKHMGAKVIATSSSDEKIERLRQLGADHTINYRTNENWGATVLELTNGRGVDHVVEVGGAGTLAQSIMATKIGGHIALIGVLTGREGTIPTAALMAKQIRLQGILAGSRSEQVEMIRAVEVMGMRPIICQSFPLESLADAFRYEAAGLHFGKIVITQ
ncbi:zinc-dependent alcohol dehydrogenase family protein [Zoogloea oleivorans]|nr:NAD(P)-dependent alcohol dehydrogenase [Zoogloea oleivorans]